MKVIKSHIQIQLTNKTATKKNSQLAAKKTSMTTSGYATWFTTGGAIRIAHCDVIDDVITRKL